MAQSLSTQRTATPPVFDASLVLDQLGTPVIVLDAAAGIVYRNLEAKRQFETRALRAFFERSDTRSLIARCISQRTATEWTGQINCDGTGEAAMWVRLHCAPISGSVPLAVLHVTPLHVEATGEAYDVSRRLASLGKLASRVAHELNNPLDGILRYINLALRVAGDAPESRLTSYLSESRMGLMRMIRIISDLLEFSRNSDAGFEDVTVNELIEQAIQACSSAAEANRVIFTADFQGGEMPRIRGTRIYQICCNLIRNSIDAMPDGGRLGITSGLVDECVVLRVTDTGVGLPQPVERVFEPFFTTKPPGKGTGLGLAICREFVEGMGGSIVAENAAGGGAVFTVRVPMERLQGPQRITPTRNNQQTFE